ncbi:MAG: ATP-binding cassette domain-containing protein [Acidobacteria bacterium]|nr:ATP-binding cassette domain-containing protein [Acidobacteriota bacterium]
MPNNPASSAPVVIFDNVSLRYGETVALDQVSFQVNAGQTWVFLGEAGSGKTQMCKVMMGLVRPDSGRVVIFGDEISSKGEREMFAVRAKIGMLFQESALFDSMTIEENVAYPLENQPVRHCGPEQIHDRVVEALRFVELEKTLDKVPSELSGGMRRRVGIARATVTQPPLAIYDSPTAGLDPITANNIMAFIAKQRDLKGTTSIIVSHRYQDGVLMANYYYDEAQGRLIAATGERLASVHTTFVVMQAGRIVFVGPQTELEASTDPYVSKFGRR